MHIHIYNMILLLGEILPATMSRKFKCSKTTRGGVGDTRLEAKAKDTKKIQGQGQPFRGQTLPRPRTGMLGAKAKDQGHRRQMFSKKKGLQPHFSSDLQKKRSAEKIFKRSIQF